MMMRVLLVATLAGLAAATPRVGVRGALDAPRFASVGATDSVGLFPSSECSKKTYPWGVSAERRARGAVAVVAARAR